MDTAVSQRTNQGLRGAVGVAAALILFFALVAAIWRFKSHYDGIAKDRAEVAYIKGVLRGNRTGLTAAEEGRLAHHIHKESRAYSLDPIFILALIQTESRYNNWSRSGKGAIGLMQILPDTGREVAETLRLPWKGKETLLNPYTNVKLGIHYYSALRGKFYNDTRDTLSAYNAGPSRVARGGASKTYAQRVLNNYKELKEGRDVPSSAESNSYGG
ncbi:MAG: lytic transglycosylase domain-containing protein [Deltaproteobacteria bacterium]|nr:lytic transglycosylase domain-containing protein [Deltaproteobacteria bacterium]